MGAERCPPTITARPPSGPALARTGESYCTAAQAIDRDRRLTAAWGRPPSCDDPFDGPTEPCPPDCATCEASRRREAAAAARCEDGTCDVLDCCVFDDAPPWMCHECGHLFGMPGDPPDGSCPNGCR
ncbi:hypothetical protein ACU686_26410 [Yinghuangia aomiensis]